MNTTCHICGNTYIPIPEDDHSPFCGRCREMGNAMTRMFNGIWTEYKLWEIQDNWGGSSLDNEFIITDKCAQGVPEPMRYSFREIFRIITKHAND